MYTVNNTKMSIYLIYFFKLFCPVLYRVILFIFNYLSSVTIPINVNIIPYCSFQVKYTLFDNKVIVDKIVFYNYKIYVAPFAVPLFKDKIKRIYLGTQNGFIAINDLNIYNVKNSPIDVEIKNINLCEILKDNKYKDSYINGKVSLKIDSNNIKCQVKQFIIKNINVNGINIGSGYLNGKYESTNIKENIKCNIYDLIINKLKIKNNSLDHLHFSGYCKSSNIRKDINCNVKTLTVNNIKVYNNSANKIHLNGFFKSSNIRKTVNCKIQDLFADVIKINNNSIGQLHFSGFYNSSDIKNNINCQIQDLTASNIRVNNNTIDNVYFNGYCNSNNIQNYIDCRINNLKLNSVKANDINIGDVKIDGYYNNNNINCELILPNFNHKSLCIGKLILNKNPVLDIALQSKTPLILNNITIKDNISLSTNCNYNIKLKHNNKNNRINLDIKTTNNKIKGIQLDDITLQGNYNNNKIQCKLNLNKWHHIINCDGILKFDNKLKYNLNINSNTPLILNNLTIVKNLPINIKSIYKFNIQENNNINGTLKMYNSAVSQYLNNINANFNINNNILNINNFNANIPSFVHGKLELNGKINLNPNNNFNSNCNIKLINGVITNIPVIKGTVDANLNLTGNINNPLLKGNITIKNPKADLTAVLSGAMLSTQIIEKFLNKKTKDNKQKKIILSPINTDINITINKILEANGPGFETTWRGDASIQCTKGRPINWNAKLSLIKGKYTIANKKLKLTSGECISNPNIKGLFTLMLAGKKKSNDAIVELKFIQQQNNTQIDFFSQPMKSKQDILALLLFDKYSAELSASDAYSLGMIIQSLASGKGSIFSKIQDTLGISIELKDNIDPSGDEYKSISVGKKIGKWKVNLERGHDNDSTKLSAERKILKNVKANVGVSKSGVEASLMWSKRY